MSNYPQQPGYPSSGYDQPMGYPPDRGANWQPPRQGMGCAAKLLIFMGVVLLGLLLLCCCTGIAGWRYVATAFTDDPAAIEQTRQEIGQIDIPNSMRPVGGMSLRMPFSNDVLFMGAFYGDQTGEKDKGGSVLMLMATGNILDQQAQEAIRRSFKESLEKQGTRPDEERPLQERREEKIVRQIRGQPAEFRLIQGKDPETKVARIQVIGTFQGKSGPTMLMMDVDAQKISEEEVRAMIDSIE